MNDEVGYVRDSDSFDSLQQPQTQEGIQQAPSAPSAPSNQSHATQLLAMAFGSEKEREVAQKTLEILRSEKYKNKCYPFQDPFDPGQLPGYVELVGKPLALRTIQINFDSYDGPSFWRDIRLVFQNAITYHGDKKETKWIAKLAKEMLKILEREKTNLENPTKKAAPKIKLKLGGADPNKPKLKLKLKGPADDKKTTDPPKKAKPTQSKFKLKISMPKASSSSASDIPKSAPKPAPKPSIKLSTTKATPKATTKPKTQKVKAASGSRGKELPQGVVMESQTSTTAKPKLKKKTSTTKKLPKSSKLDEAQRVLCYKILTGLKRRNNKKISWFANPVSDKNILADYKSKIKNPMDLMTITNKLEKGSYKNLDAFCLDLRRVFANALRYNTSIKDSLRPIAVEILQSAERLLVMFLGRYYPNQFKSLLYCWKICIDILDTLYNLVNPNDGQPMAYYFLHPVSVYCGGHFPADYLQKVTTPMDFGTVTANLVEGKYTTVEAFASDCRLVVENCQTYYEGREDGKVFVDQALQLNQSLTSQLTQLARYDKVKGNAERQKQTDAMNPTKILNEIVLPNQPPVALYLNVLEDLRALKYTDKGTNITQPAVAAYEKPVNTTTFTDYSSIVTEPMNLQTVERKIKQNCIYQMPEDFEYDMNLIFKNAERYSSQRNDQHSVAMAKFAARKFRSIFYAKMQAFEDPSSVTPISAPSSSVDPSSPPNKKIKIDLSAKGRPAPRISISSAQVSAAARTKTTAKAGGPQKAKGNQPVPLHIAIAKVKEAFPLRRAVKTLQSWEADCARYMKELMRHPWITTTRPKFIFHVPVPTLFPELSETYAAKIRKPMDLTTIECTLLAGNRYATPEDFLQDVALVFENAIKFNRDGKDVGDPLSCAYYDASVHLLRYSRWLSMELLSNHTARSDHKDESGADGLPPFRWRLTEGNKEVARKETESIVLKEPLDRSLEGDRYTWMESECEKLLKALRHQSDLKHMTFFIHTTFPPDYAAYISNPLDWEKVNRTLKRRQYENIGQLVDDLRLIFSNAEKYNSRNRGTDTLSGKVFDAAKFMSAKLELAINKMLLSVGDRLERERIDHVNAEREIEAAERAEEAKIRATWKKSEAGDAGPTEAPKVEGVQRSRVVRRVPQRRVTDFEIPFFDEDDNGRHERSYVEVIKFQKSMFEKQREDLVKMRNSSEKIGVAVLVRQRQRDKLRKKLGDILKRNTAEPMDVDPQPDKKNDEQPGTSVASAVLDELTKSGRRVVFMKIGRPKGMTKKKRNTPILGFD